MADQFYYEEQSYNAGQMSGVNQQDMELTVRMPINHHIVKLNNLLEDLQNELEDSKRNLQNLRNDIVALGHLNNEACSEVSRYIMDETLRLSRDFRKLVSVEADETVYLKQQVQQLVQDRIRLQQNTLVLENRVQETEKDIGFRHMYD